MRLKKMLLVVLSLTVFNFANCDKKEDMELTNKIIGKMSDQEKVGQLMMVDFRNWDEKPFTTMNNDIKTIIDKYKFGGVILFRENVENKVQTTKLINELQKITPKSPLFIGIDQEGGYVTRLQDGTEMPGNMALGAANNYENTKKVGEVIGKELNALGVNINFGPVVDVNSNQKNPIIGVRSFGDDPKLVGNMANAYVDGLHSEGVMTSLKHFPGHGNTSSDTHIGLATVDYNKTQWEEIDKVPFEMAIKNGADTIMTAHVIVPALDDTKIKSKKDGKMIGLPATLSKPIMTDILKNDMNFKGLIITDALNMNAISENFGKSEAIIMSILAGADIMLMPSIISNKEDLKALDKIYGDILEEMEINEELSGRVNESVEKIVKLKLKKGLINGENILRNPEKAKKIVGSKENKLIEKNAAEKGITLIKNEGNILPFNIENDKKILVLSDTSTRNFMIKDEIENLNKGVKVYTEVVDFKEKIDSTVKNYIDENDYIVVATYNLDSKTEVNSVIDYANNINKKLVMISTRNPYDIAYTPTVKANIAIYGITGFDQTNYGRNSLEANIRAGVRTIFTGENKEKFNIPTAKLPVNIKNGEGKILYNRGYGLTY